MEEMDVGDVSYLFRSQRMSDARMAKCLCVLVGLFLLVTVIIASSDELRSRLTHREANQDAHPLQLPGPAGPGMHPAVSAAAALVKHGGQPAPPMGGPGLRGSVKMKYI